MLLLVLSLLLLLPNAEAVVKFKHSQLFDQFDLKGQAKVPLLCTNGCYVYASLRENKGDFENQVFIAGEDGKLLHSLSEIARTHYAESLEKKRFDFIPQAGNYYIMRTQGNLDDVEPLTIYVIDMFREIKQVTLVTKNVVFLDADYFTMKNFRLGTETGQNRVRVYAAGPDVPIGNDYDNCFALFDNRLEFQSTTDVAIPMHSPLATVTLESSLQIKIELMQGAKSPALLDGTSFGISSPGYIGCKFATGLYRWNYPNLVNELYLTANRCTSSISVTFDQVADTDSFLGFRTDTNHFVYKTSGTEAHTYDTVSLIVEWADAASRGNNFGLRGTVKQTAPGCTPPTVPTPSSIATSLASKPPMSSPPPSNSPLPSNPPPSSASSPFPSITTSTKSAPSLHSLTQSLIEPFIAFALI